MPKIFRMKKNGKVDKAIFEGDTINTPSMICVEDYLDALSWADQYGLDKLCEKSMGNLNVVENWVERTPWIDFLASAKEIRSNTSVCLSVISDKVRALAKDDQSKFLKSVSSDLSKRGIAYDINSYKDAPPGYRFWCGPTIEEADLTAALEELEKAYNEKIKVL
jgi:phosphoserine aminotransferase